MEACPDSRKLMKTLLFKRVFSISKQIYIAIFTSILKTSGVYTTISKTMRNFCIVMRNFA